MALFFGFVSSIPCRVPADDGNSLPGGSLSRYKPHWHVGQTWRVETEVPVWQAGAKLKRTDQVTILRWQFMVEKMEEVGDEPCYVLTAKPEDAAPEGISLRLWVGAHQLVLRRGEITTPYAGNLVSAGEKFFGVDGVPYPGTLPFLLLPVAFPSWEEISLKSVNEFRYEAVTGTPQVKEAAQSRFVIPIRQHVDTPTQEFVKSVLKIPTDVPVHSDVVRVELQTPLGRWEQLWEAGRPWPVWATNGFIRARLITQ